MIESKFNWFSVSMLNGRAFCSSSPKPVLKMLLEACGHESFECGSLENILIDFSWEMVTWTCVAEASVSISSRSPVPECLWEQLCSHLGVAPFKVQKHSSLKTASFYRPQKKRVELLCKCYPLEAFFAKLLFSFFLCQDLFLGGGGWRVHLYF